MSPGVCVCVFFFFFFVVVVVVVFELRFILNMYDFKDQIKDIRIKQ